MRFVLVSLFLPCILINQVAFCEVDLDEDEKLCIESTLVPESFVIYAKEYHEVPAGDAKYKEFLACLWKRYGYMDADGKIERKTVEEVLEKAYSRENSRKLVDECDHIRGATHGDTVALVLKCLDDHAPSVHSLYNHYG